jgi:phosphatidylglycerol:prolipoprotein diacylglycerol transferase
MYQYLFFIGDFPIRAYGLILCMSIILAVGLAWFLTKQDGRWHQHVPDMGIYCAISGIIGARLWNVFFFDWAYYQHHLLEIPFVWQGGMSIQGGIIFGVIAGYIYTKIHKIDTWTFADIVAPAIILGQALGRIANLLNGDAFGRPTGGNFGIIYPETTLAYQTYGAQPLWPVEIWEGQIDVVIFVILMIMRTTNHAKGQVFVAYAVLYSSARFFLEYLRGDYEIVMLGLKSAQLTSLAVIIIGSIIFVYLGMQKKPPQIENSNKKKRV